MPIDGNCKDKMSRTKRFRRADILDDVAVVLATLGPVSFVAGIFALIQRFLWARAWFVVALVFLWAALQVKERADVERERALAAEAAEGKQPLKLVA